VGFDMFVQRFRAGEAVPMPSAAFEVFRPYVDGTQPEHDFWHLRAADGGVAEIYARVAPETFDSLMFSRFSSGVVLDLLVEFARQADAVVLAPGCPALLAAETQRRQLPGEFQNEAVVALDGRDIEQVLSSC
jgi:hypothetical protein